VAHRPRVDQLGDRPVRRLDEVRAAKQPVLRYLFDDSSGAALESAGADSSSRENP